MFEPLSILICEYIIIMEYVFYFYLHCKHYIKHITYFNENH